MPKSLQKICQTSHQRGKENHQKNQTNLSKKSSKIMSKIYLNFLYMNMIQVLKTLDTILSEMPPNKPPHSP